MAIVYTETLIDDVTTDADSPLNETLMQNIGQSVNYLLDSCFDGGGNSELLNIATTIAATNPADMDMYVSSWVAIGTNADFAHGLGRTPTVVFAWISDDTGYANSALLGAQGIGDAQVDAGAYIASVDGTNINITNPSTPSYYFLVVAW
jgi:hypothetical protein